MDNICTLCGGRMTLSFLPEMIVDNETRKIKETGRFLKVVTLACPSGHSHAGFTYDD